MPNCFNYQKLTFIILIFVFAFRAYSQDNTAVISGTVIEHGSGEFVTGVNVVLYADSTMQGKPIRGAVTNKFGFYSIANIPAGKYYLVTRGVGYESFIRQVQLTGGQKLTLNIDLNEKDIKTQEITVEAQKEHETIKNISVNEVSPDLISKLPSIGGEVDIFRALQFLPGIQQSNELSSGLYVRGGSPDQNLVLLDGVIVYNPSHLAGFLSTFNNDAIRDVRVIKGGFPAEYGGRLSSVIDLTMKEGSKQKYSATGGISLISSRLTVEGPIDDKSSFMISGRRMYLDLLLSLMPNPTNEPVPTYYFYDLNAKINRKLSDNDQLFLSGYFGKDVLDVQPENDNGINIFWGNTTGNLRWMHIVSPSLFTNFSAIYTNYNFQTDLNFDSYSDSLSRDEKIGFKSYSGIKDFMFRGEAEYFPHENHSIKAGIETVYHDFIANVASDKINAELIFGKPNNISAIEAAFYLQDEWKITPQLSSNLGARLYYFNKGNYFSVEPRLSLAYELFDNFSLKGSFAIANQFLHMITRNDVNLPTDLWFPSTATVKPSKSMQGIFGAEYTLPGGEYLFSVEGYYKSMQNLYEYKEDADFSLGIPLESQFTVGKGDAYGVEFFVNKRIGSFVGWIGYTLAWTTRQFDSLNYGKEFPPRYDRRHDISVVLTYELGESWELGATWTYGTGQAYTMPTGIYSFVPDGAINFGPETKYQYTDRNGFRLPSYHRLDLNFMYKFKWFKVPFQFSINIYNAYNRKNPFAWYFSYDSNLHKQVLKQITLFPIIPTFGLSFKI